MARILRSGFIDPDRTDDFNIKFKPGTPKSTVIRALQSKGFAIGKEIDYDAKKGGMPIDVRRTGKIATGFDAASGFNLRDVESWTPQQKQRVTRVYNQIKELTERPYYVYRGRKKENIERVQEATSPYAYPKEVTIAFVPVARPGEAPKIKFTKTRVLSITDEPKTIETVTIVERDVKTMPIYWEDVGVSEKMLREDPKGAINKMHAAIGAKQYSPMAGTKQQPESYDAPSLAREVIRLQNEYPERWPQFLLGVIAYSFPKQTDLQSYRRSRERAKLAQRKVRKADRDRFRRQTKGRRQRKR